MYDVDLHPIYVWCLVLLRKVPEMKNQEACSPKIKNALNGYQKP